MEETCSTHNCESRKCKALCNTLKCWKIKGHLTHDPHRKTISTFVGDRDVKGNSGSQYFTESTDPNKTADATKVADYLKEKNIIPYPKGQQFIDGPYVTNKIDP